MPPKLFTRTMTEWVPSACPPAGRSWSRSTRRWPGWGNRYASDLYQIHRFDPDVPVEETMEALHHVVKGWQGPPPSRLLERGRGGSQSWNTSPYRPRLDPVRIHAGPATWSSEKRNARGCSGAVDQGVGASREPARRLFPSPGPGGSTARPPAPRATRARLGWPLFLDSDKAIVDAVRADRRSTRRVDGAGRACLGTGKTRSLSAPIIAATHIHHLADAVVALDIELTGDEISALQQSYSPRGTRPYSRPTPIPRHAIRRYLEVRRAGSVTRHRPSAARDAARVGVAAQPRRSNLMVPPSGRTGVSVGDHGSPVDAQDRGRERFRCHPPPRSHLGDHRPATMDHLKSRLTAAKVELPGDARTGSMDRAGHPPPRTATAGLAPPGSRPPVDASPGQTCRCRGVRHRGGGALTFPSGRFDPVASDGPHRVLRVTR